ncbi:hypothetical protein QBC37DRAFT_460941 [Rhypophila decipiens]|uniref:Uncharacterized protein n=1 Tax=Rhypophila decipiens TaxID=261697 RepID=A0AAN6XT62_9PEZI|nr:hypothetical protein QBC37DRAFT_460941 [Rhypophila decipiens]
MTTFPATWNNSAISGALDPSPPSMDGPLAPLRLRQLHPEQSEEARYDSQPGSRRGIHLLEHPTAPRFFRFGGYYPMNNDSAIHFEPAPEHIDEVGLTWSYDVISQVWRRESNADILTGLAAGASATNSFTNEGYFLGGGRDSWVLEGSPNFYVDGMVTLNMSDSIWGNDTVPGPAISGGFMEYLPVGRKGILVVFGGVLFPEGVAQDGAGILTKMKKKRKRELRSGASRI